MRKFVVEDGLQGEDEGTAFTAVAPTTATRVIVGFTATTTAAAAVATTTASNTTAATVATGGDDDDDDSSNSRTTAFCRPGNRVAAESVTVT
jgi:hypothetical protein